MKSYILQDLTLRFASNLCNVRSTLLDDKLLDQ